MKSQRVIHERKQSPPARCTQMIADSLAGRICGAEMGMLVTKSPLSALPYEELLALRCPFHIIRADGVLLDA